MYILLASNITPRIAEYIQANKDSFVIKNIGESNNKTITFIDVIIEERDYLKIKAVSEDEYNILMNSKTCPTCRRRIVSGLCLDYRGSMCVGKVYHCMDCVHLTDEKYAEILSCESLNERCEKMISYLD